MVKINRIIFGYRTIKVDPSDVKTISNLFLRNCITADVFPDGTVIIEERDASRINDLLSGRIEYCISECLGVYGALKRIRCKRALFFSCLITALALVFLSDLVWDVRVSGNENVSAAEIVCALREQGLFVGKMWTKVDRSQVETDTLLSMSTLGWININRRGAVAYVEVIEKEGQESIDEIQSIKYSNIVAEVDCVIEEITVERGVAVVKPGDVVKKGDLLISGLITTDGVACRAIGVVKGRMADRVTVYTLRNDFEIIDEEDKLCSITLNLFDFSINILKIYGNLTSECDIIEDVEEYSFLGSGKLPISLTKIYSKSYVKANKTYSDEELVDITSKRLASATHSRLVSADLLRIKTDGRFTDDGYEMYSDIVFVGEVGRETEILVD